MSVQWIWLNPIVYPEFQKNEQYIFLPKTCKDCVVDFKKTICFSKTPKQVTLHVSGDALFRLWQNGQFVGQGPASAGGDFLMKEPLPWHYANQYILYPKTNELQFFAEVRLQPQEMTDIVGGQGGFYLYGIAQFADGTTQTFGTDATWQVRVDRRFVAPYVYDETIEAEDWQFAVPIKDSRNLQVAPIPSLCYEIVYPKDNTQHRFCLQKGDCSQIEFARIYSAHVALRCDRPCHLKIACYETPEVRVSQEEITLTGTQEYRSLYMKSIGMIEISVLDCNDAVTIEPYLYFSHYPVEAEGNMYTSDKELDLVYDVCKWTLKICRQTLHLDSPKHQELLACSGDYYIESMMTAFTFGDMRLASFDIRRTAL